MFPQDAALWLKFTFIDHFGWWFVDEEVNALSDIL